MVFVAWYVIYNEEEDEFYLWNRKRAYKNKVTITDYLKAIPKGMSPDDFSLAELEAYLPIRLRVQKGVFWKDVEGSRAGLSRDQIEHIEQQEKYQGTMLVKAFVGWSAYPGVRSYPKGS